MIGNIILVVCAAAWLGGWITAFFILFRGIGPVAARSPSPQSATLKDELMALSSQAQALVDRIKAVGAKVPDAITAAEQAQTAQFSEDIAGVSTALAGLESAVNALLPAPAAAAEPVAEASATEAPVEGQ